MRNVVALWLVLGVVGSVAPAWSANVQKESLRQRVDALAKLRPVDKARSVIAILREEVDEPGGPGDERAGMVSQLMVLLAEQAPDRATLRDAARNEANPVLRQRFAITGCLAGEGSLTQEVGKILTDPKASPHYRAAAAEALSRHPSASNIPALVKALSTDAAWMGNPVRNPTTRRIERWRKYFYVRAAAQRALRRYQIAGVPLDIQTRNALADAVLEVEP